MKPKIIFAVTNDLTYDQRMIRICTSLAENGYEVLFVGRVKTKSIPLRAEKFQQKRFNLFFEKGKLFYLEYNLRLFFFLLKNRFDAVGSIDLDTLLPCFLATKLKRKPCIFDAHEYFTEVPEVINRPFTKKIWETLANLLIPRLQYAYTVSASLQRLFTEKYGVPFELIRNISVYRENIKVSSKFRPTKPMILYQGVLNEGRGLEAMIEAMQFIDEAEFWLAGEGDLSKKLRQLTDKLDLNHKVKFLGYLPPQELQALTPLAAIGINLIENRGLSYYYSLANKTFDYMHAEVPALHMNFPEYQSIMKTIKIGELVEDLSSKVLVNSVQLLLICSENCKKVKENCKKGKLIFNWKKEEARLLAFYNRILC